MKGKGWLKTIIVGGVGGGIAGSVAALADPTKYVFPRDLFSGKMWPFFLQGAALTIGALFLKSPLGVSLVDQFKEHRELIDETKETFKPEGK